MSLRIVVGLLISVVLAACATTPAPAKKPVPTASKAKSEVIAPKPKTDIHVEIDPNNNKKPGGYYKDDGPATPPAGAEVLPEPTPVNEPELPRANVPYTVEGEVVTPERGKKNYSQAGLASWYGKAFHGRKTASGEKFNMFGFSAAHRTLPIPCFARVTNPKNGISVIVRVNDRGPFHKKRLIDLSFAAAQKLDIVKAGQAQVLVERVFPEDMAKEPEANKTPQASSSEPASIDSSKVYWQLGAFKYVATAKHLANRIRPQLPEGTSVIILPAGAYFRVIAGPYDTEEAAQNQHNVIQEALGHAPVFYRPTKVAVNR